MAVIYQGILGSLSGKVGPVVGGSWKGIAYLRGYQHQVAQPNTADQVAQRTRMARIVLIAQTFLTTVIKPCNDRFAVHMSGFNLFVSRNIGFISSLGVPTFPSLVFSQGSLTGPALTSLTGTNGSASVSLVYTDNTGTGTALATDEVYVAILNETNGASGSLSGTRDRSDLTATITMSAACTTADVLHGYVSMRSANGFNVSDSVYITDTV